MSDDRRPTPPPKSAFAHPPPMAAALRRSFDDGGGGAVASSRSPTFEATEGRGGSDDDDDLDLEVVEEASSSDFEGLVEAAFDASFPDDGDGDDDPRNEGDRIRMRREAAAAAAALEGLRSYVRSLPLPPVRDASKMGSEEEEDDDDRRDGDGGGEMTWRLRSERPPAATATAGVGASRIREYELDVPSAGEEAEEGGGASSSRPLRRRRRRACRATTCSMPGLSPTRIASGLLDIDARKRWDATIEDCVVSERWDAGSEVGDGGKEEGEGAILAAAGLTTNADADDGTPTAEDDRRGVDDEAAASPPRGSPPPDCEEPPPGTTGSRDGSDGPLSGSGAPVVVAAAAPPPRTAAVAEEDADASERDDADGRGEAREGTSASAGTAARLEALSSPLPEDGTPTPRRVAAEARAEDVDGGSGRERELSLSFDTARDAATEGSSKASASKLLLSPTRTDDASHGGEGAAVAPTLIEEESSAFEDSRVDFAAGVGEGDGVVDNDDDAPSTDDELVSEHANFSDDSFASSSSSSMSTSTDSIASDPVAPSDPDLDDEEEEDYYYHDEWKVRVPRSKPPFIPIANFADRASAIDHLRSLMLDDPLSDDFDDCMSCGSTFPTTYRTADCDNGIKLGLDRTVCPCCGLVVCRGCTESNDVWEVRRGEVLEVCGHCYENSSRIRFMNVGATKAAAEADAVEDAGLGNAEGEGEGEEGGGTTPGGSSAEGRPAGRIPPAGMRTADLLDRAEAVERLTSLMLGELDDDADAAGGRTGNNGGGVSECMVCDAGPLRFRSSPRREGGSSISERIPVEDACEEGVPGRICSCCGSILCAECCPRDVWEINLGTIVPVCDHCHSHSSRIGPPTAPPAPASSSSVPPAAGSSDGTTPREAGLERSARRIGRPCILYRTTRRSGVGKERCFFQDSFVNDRDGTTFVYEVPVDHQEVAAGGRRCQVRRDEPVVAYIASPDDDRQGRDGSFFTILRLRNEEAGPTTMALLPPWAPAAFLEDDGWSSASDMINNMLLECVDSPEGGARRGGSDEPVSVQDFDLLSVIGRGGFGKVLQVRHRPTGRLYAMKIIDKENMSSQQVERANTERFVLEKGRHHPFVASLHCAFQSRSKLYMVMDFVQGGDFFTLLKERGRMAEYAGRFYVSEIVSAIRYMHDMNVIYRDLKPENVLICRDGHAVLVDFGLSRRFDPPTVPPSSLRTDEDGRGRRPQRTFSSLSFCGTEQYMAPEMLLHRGHGTSVDYWSLGLVMHEMLAGRHPFRASTHPKTLANVVGREPRLDERLSSDASDLIRGLLEKDPLRRIGAEADDGTESLTSHPFFREVSWEDVEAKRIRPPYVPELNGPIDVSKFEDVFTREEATDSLGVAGKSRRKRNRLLRFFLAMGGSGRESKSKRRLAGGTMSANRDQDDRFSGFDFNVLGC